MTARIALARMALLAYMVAVSTAVAVAQTEEALEPLNAFPRSKLEIELPAKRHRFEVWVADTSPRRAQGLMYVKTLARMHGMLFLYPEPQVISMWMKNTVIPLDMLFVADDGRITRIARHTVPLSLDSITSMGPVIAVIELGGGEAERLGIETGARVLHPAFGTR